jgi:type I restriction enzyme S subunit
MRRVRKGTLLMSFKLTIGRLCFAGLDLYTNEAICSLSNLKVSAEYLYYILSITDFSLSGSQAAKGYTLNSESLHCLNVPLPPTRSEQEAIAALLSDLDSEIETLEARLEKTRRIKLGMAQALLTGRVRVA